MPPYKWKVSKQKGIVYYSNTDEGLQALVLRLAKGMHSTQTITIELTPERISDESSADVPA